MIIIYHKYKNVKGYIDLTREVQSYYKNMTDKNIKNIPIKIDENSNVNGIYLEIVIT